MNGKMKKSTNLSLTEKPQNKHDALIALSGIQKNYNSNFATEGAEPVRCVKYLQTSCIKYEKKEEIELEVQISI